MATIYYARDGQGDSKEDGGRQVDAIAITRLLASHKVRRLPEPNTVIGGTHQANWATDYKYVVLRVEAAETSSKFPNPGLYLIEDLSPGQYEQLVADARDP